MCSFDFFLSFFLFFFFLVHSFPISLLKEGGNKREIAEPRSICSSGTGIPGRERKRGRKERAKERGRNRGNTKTGRRTFTKGLAGVLYIASDRRDKELGGNGGSCES